MPRKNRNSSRRSNESSKNPQQPSPSSKTEPLKPPKLLPPWLQKQWTPDEVWALMAQTERSYSMKEFSDTPPYWNSVAPLFPNASAEKLRSIHLSILQFQRAAVSWKKDEIRTLIASVCANIKETEDTPQWWGKVASRFPKRTALDCRIAFKTYGLSEACSETTASESQPQQSSTAIDAVITSFERASIESPKTSAKGKRKVEEEEEHRNFVVSPEKASKGKEKLETCKSERSSAVEPLQNWSLEDYMFLMKVLTRNLICKWRPSLLAALAKADRMTASSSGVKERGTCEPGED